MTSYKQAGVDVQAGDDLVDRIKPLAAKTISPLTVLSGIGGFAAMYDLRLVQAIKALHDPILVSGTDGVGTKLKLAFHLNRHDTVGIDLVAMCVNDVITTGAIPLFFLDYFACGKLDVDVASIVVSGIAEGCMQAGCALVGGETAEMPGMYPAGEYDIAGFAVGVVDRKDIIDGSTIVPGDAIIGLASSGLHSNGYSLVRKLIEPIDLITNDKYGNKTLKQWLLEPTTIYAKLLQHLRLVARTRTDIKGTAHITGGGLVGNVPRILNNELTAIIRTDRWERPAIYEWLQQKGIDEEEMLNTFNCGIGFVIIADQSVKQTIIDSAKSAGVNAWDIGYVATREQGQQQTVFL